MLRIACRAANGREHRRITHDPTMAHLFVSGVEDQIFDLAEGPIAPGRQFVIKKLGGAADLRSGQALDPELAHHRLGVPRGDALDIHLGHRQHHGAHRAPPALQRLRVEGLAFVISRLGHLHRDRAGRRIDALGLVAVGIALPLGTALVETGAEKPFALDLHGQFESSCEDRRYVSGTVFDQMFHEGLNRRILSLVHSSVSHGCFAIPWNTRMGSPCRGRPRQGLTAPAPNEFPDLKLHHHRRWCARVLDGAARGLSRHARAEMLGPQDGEHSGCHAQIPA
jgi:hypothetical protein